MSAPGVDERMIMYIIIIIILLKKEDNVSLSV